MLLSLALTVALAADQSTPIAPTQPVQLGLSLALTHGDEMAKLRRAQLDPAPLELREAPRQLALLPPL
jgi:hypothetical protein